MNFNSFQFLIFYPIVAVLNYIVPRKYRWIPLLIASYYFYLSWNAKLFFLILFTTAVSYASGLLIEKKPKQKGEPSPRRSGRNCKHDGGSSHPAERDPHWGSHRPGPAGLAEKAAGSPP